VLFLSYRSDRAPALRGVDLDVPGGARLAVVGRTGAGKTTLAACLLRLLELDAGAIEVDGVDIAALGLDDVRRAIAYVPQEATCFSGDVRDALDPLRLCAGGDAAYAAAVARVGLALAGGLDARVADGGLNLSVGQRQQLCVARALLRRAKIVVLDESSASLDAAADAALQAALRDDDALRGATVIAIAHRIAGTLDADLVLVLDGGRVVEFGPPADLVKRDGAYAALVRAAQTQE